MTLHIAIANGERCKCLKDCCVYNLQEHYKSILLSYLLSSLSVWWRNCVLAECDRQAKQNTHEHAAQPRVWAERWISFCVRSTWNWLTFICTPVCQLAADMHIMYTETLLFKNICKQICSHNIGTKFQLRASCAASCIHGYMMDMLSEKDKCVGDFPCMKVIMTVIIICGYEGSVCFTSALCI